MRNATDLMVAYAKYHRDPRNIATHFVGIPLIVFSVGVILGRPPMDVAGITLTPAWILWTMATLWYLTRGHLSLAIAVSAMNFVLFAAAQTVTTMSTSIWLSVGIGAFVVGWVIQFIGHLYEGKKPAFIDDISGLIVGPMFVAAEALFAVGCWRGLNHEIARQAGPIRLRNLHPKATPH